ncbi:hypothetical protein ALC53_04801 [Atta colombica]|uniref:Uncharacterized protein n=1 Tax=Atta colombica TaxID=520822 RepID=A0A195BK32_9HYME|nr:hypothetical protein ALC53_04801 [Atta colombica]
MKEENNVRHLKLTGCLHRIDTHVQLCINYWYAVPDNRADIDAIINNFLQGRTYFFPAILEKGKVTATSLLL